ncbi:MAG: hypothetical protein SynsKO_40770 [Synoicihabitans sp.]
MGLREITLKGVVAQFGQELAGFERGTAARAKQTDEHQQKDLVGFK